MCAVDRIVTAGDQLFMDEFGLEGPEVGPLDEMHYPMRSRPVIRATGDRREWVVMNWGLIPAWARDEKVGRNAFNARIESLVEGKPMFREAFRKRRCLVPATSYFEYTTQDGRKVPYEFRVNGGAPYAYAGLWETRGELLTTTVVTTPPNAFVAQFHTRMPAILRPEDYDAWLDPRTPPAELLDLLDRFPGEAYSAALTDIFGKPTQEALF